MKNTRLSELAIEYLSVETLLPNPHNSRTHSKHQIRQIADSIKAFGFTNPILIDAKNTVVADHGRVAGAKLDGVDLVPTIRLENLSAAQIRAYVLADNRLAEKAGWDKSRSLRFELQHLLTIENDFEVTVTGFEIPEIDLILQEANSKPDSEDVFDIDETDQAITKSGDLWLLRKHRVLCGNALQQESYATLMGSRRAAVVFVDPPYNVPIDGHATGNGSIRHREFQMASGDMSEAEFVAFLITSLRLLVRYSAGGSVHFACMDWRHMGELLAAGRQVYDRLLNVCVWIKSNAGMGSFYRSQHELIFVFKNGKAPRVLAATAALYCWGLYSLPDDQIARSVSSGFVYVDQSPQRPVWHWGDFPYGFTRSRCAVGWARAGLPRKG